MTKNHKIAKGFTLVELIVVIIIIAVLVAVAIPGVNGFMESARRSRIRSEHRTLVYAVQTFIGVNEKSPQSLDDLKPYVQKNKEDYEKNLAQDKGQVAHKIIGTRLESTFTHSITGASQVFSYDFENNY